jgi:hypothetical protein
MHDIPDLAQAVGRARKLACDSGRTLVCDRQLVAGAKARRPPPEPQKPPDPPAIRIAYALLPYSCSE